VGGGRVAVGADLDDRAGDQVVGGVQLGQHPAGLGLVLGGRHGAGHAHVEPGVGGEDVVEGVDVPGVDGDGVAVQQLLDGVDVVEVGHRGLPVSGTSRRR
jgi:hypothetical protein